MTSLFPRRPARRSIAQLRSEMWAADEAAITAALDDAEAMIERAPWADLRAAMSGEFGAATYAYDVRDGVATLPIRGMLLASVPWWASLMGLDATGYDDVRAALDDAVSRSDVREIVLDVDSGGGSVNGLVALADALAAAPKPMRARVRTAASAAYWLASQADTVEIERGGEAGSVGVYTVLADSSRAAEGKGVSVRVVRAGRHKGVGEPGAPIEDDQIAEIQRRVDEMAAEFRQAIARGRGMEQGAVDALADGRVFSAEDAVRLGLADRVIGAPTGAQEAQTVSNESGTSLGAQAYEAKIAEQAAQIEKLSARAVAAEQALHEIGERAKAEVIDAGVKAGRITPAMRPSVDAFAAKATPDELRAFVAGLPQQTRPTFVGESETQKDEKKAPARWSAYHADGTVTLEDGRRVPASEVL